MKEQREAKKESVKTTELYIGAKEAPVRLEKEHIEHQRKAQAKEERKAGMPEKLPEKPAGKMQEKPHEKPAAKAHEEKHAYHAAHPPKKGLIHEYLQSWKEIKSLKIAIVVGYDLLFYALLFL